MRGQNLARVVAPLIAVLIAVLSLTPVSLSPIEPFRWSDKIEHTVAYLFLGASVARAFAARSWRAAALVVAFCAAYGGAIELIQAHVGRDAELADWAADILGAAAGVLGAVGRRPPGGGQDSDDAS